MVGRVLLRPFCTKDLCSRRIAGHVGPGVGCLTSPLVKLLPAGEEFCDDDDSCYRKGCDLSPYSVCFCSSFTVSPALWRSRASLGRWILESSFFFFRNRWGDTPLYTSV